MVYFLHMNSKSEGGWTVLALIFTSVMVVITLTGSLWVMDHLNSNMMPMSPGRCRPIICAACPDRDALKVEPATGSPRSLASLISLGIAAALVFAVLAALGTWQLERRAWKLELIERVTTRVHAPPTAAPGRAEWPLITAADYEYQHVRVGVSS